MNEKTKEAIENQVRAIQAQLELLLIFLDNAVTFEEKKVDEKEKKKKRPFTGKTGECDRLCDESDFLRLASFGDSKEKIQCIRCDQLLENNGGKTDGKEKEG